MVFSCAVTMLRGAELQAGPDMSTQAFEKLVTDANSNLLFLCDHASNAVPPEVGGGSLGLSEADMGRHIAYDIGARGLTSELSKLMNGIAVMSTFSRLVIDPNRGEDDPTLIMQLYDGTMIPENRNLTDEDHRHRLETYYRPYHQEVTQTLEAMKTPKIVSIHSFTPNLAGKPQRPWHIGVLSADDRRLADPLLERLTQAQDLCVGDNEPYVGSLEGDCMARHGLAKNIPHVLIEVRNDLIETKEMQANWAARLATVMADVLGRFEQKENGHG